MQSLDSLLALVVLFVARSKVSCDGCNNGTFDYFAYGSNLLKNRIHINNPSAIYQGIAKLENYRLDFNITVPAWRGAAATIVPDSGHTVWGTLWTLNWTDMAQLDRQEGVHRGWYYSTEETVITTHGPLKARVYIETHSPPKEKILPMKRRPSITYLETIILGAIKSKLPEYYIEYLFSFPVNGQFATKERRDQLGYPFNTPI